MPLDGLDAVRSIELDAPPALCVIAACLGAVDGPPDFVLSGINPGLNTGRSTFHSGTVGAALTAAHFGVSAVAVSIDGHESAIENWAVAGGLAVQAVEWAARQEGITTINLSVPDRPHHELSDTRFGSLAPLGTVHTEVLGRDEEWLRLGFRLTEQPMPEGSDSRLVADGHVVVTPVQGIRAVPGADVDGLISAMTAHTRGGG